MTRKRTLKSLPPCPGPLQKRPIPNIPPVENVAMSNSGIRVGEQILFDFQEAAEEIPGGKVGILFSTENAKYLYLVNLGSTEPIFKIVLDSALGFCVFKSKLFAFDHCDPFLGDKHSRGRYTGQSVYQFDIPSKWNLGDMELSKKDMSRVCRMRGSKCFPKGLPSPDGKKMVIFSSMITLGTRRPRDYHFELFDLEQGKCIEKLPSPSFFNPEYYHREFAMINSFAFINTRTFFILTDGEDMFSIDLDESIKKRFWEPWRSFSGRSAPELPLANFLLLGQNICCLGYNACFNIDSLDKDVPHIVCSLFEEDACHYTYPELSSFPTEPEVLGGGGGAVIVGEDAGKVKLCIMRAFSEDFGEDFGDDLDKHKIYMSVDVYICDLAECADGVRQDLAKKRLENERERKKKIKRKACDWMLLKPMILPGIKKVGSLRFGLIQRLLLIFARRISSPCSHSHR